MRLAVPASSAAVVPAVPAALSLLVVRVQAAVRVQVAARALRAALEQAVLVAPAAREGPEVLEGVLFVSRVRIS